MRQSLSAVHRTFGARQIGLAGLLVLGVLLGLFTPRATIGQVPLEDRKLTPLPPMFRIEDPGVVMSGVPVNSIFIEALTSEGQRDVSFQDRAMISGIILKQGDQPVALPNFQDGVLSLQTDFAAQRRVYIVNDTISVHKLKHPEQTTVGHVVKMPGFLSLFPALMAIGIAIWLRNVIVALFAGVWIGSILLARGNFFIGFIRCLDKYLLEQLTQPNDPGHSHLLIVLFTMFLGAMIGVMSSSGGTNAIVVAMARFTRTRQQGQLMTWLLGMVVFFDDYANSLLLGTTMQPVTDRLKISREKLSFLVDSTAAPIAGLALVSTWVGFEIGQIQDTYETLGLSSDGVYQAFLYSIPYRFYALHLVAFVGLIALIGNDFGPMLHAEARTLAFHKPLSSEPSVEEEAEVTPDRADRKTMLCAIIPVVALIVSLVVGIWWTGNEALSLKNAEAAAQKQPQLEVTLWRVVSMADSNRMLFFSSFAASLVAVMTAVALKTMTIRTSVDAWLNGAKSMFLAIVILVMAWAIAELCDSNHLNTAGYLIEHTQHSLAVQWVPSVVFLLAAVIAMSTGSSFTTMGLLMPLAITITHTKLVALDQAGPEHHLMLASIGAVLAGAIFGDHCSPISDTTVLSSAATGCDHLDHVTTQIPYATTVAVVSLLFGYIPIGFGYYFLPALLPMGAIVLFLIVQFYGQSAEDEAEAMLAEFEAVAAAAITEEDDEDGEVQSEAAAPPPED